MRRILLLVASLALGVVVTGGLALAATIHCPNDPAPGSLSCYGTSLADTLYGSELADYMYGKGGADTMHGYGSGDYLEGGKGSDHLYGDAGADFNLWGGAYDASTNTNNDASDDYVHGGSGKDTVYGGMAQGGVDRVYGEGGNDLIYASQRNKSFSPVTKEIIDCGSGASDEVWFDKGVDVFVDVHNCEIRHHFP